MILDSHISPLATITLDSQGTVAGSHVSSLATITLDSQASSDQARAVGRFVHDRRGELVRLAARWIRRYGVADAAFDAEDAVQGGVLKALQAVKDGKIHVDDVEALATLLRRNVADKVLNERARERARIRGGTGASNAGREPAVRCDDAGLATIGSHVPGPDEQVIAEEEVERMLALLERRDARLRVVATAKADGLTHPEIASQLGRPLPTVDYWVRLIKVILSTGDPDPRS